MKKVLSILLAVLMTFSTFGMFSFAADPEISDDVFTLQDALNIAASMKNGDQDVAPTVLVFNTGTAKLGTVYMSPQVYYINAGANKGCYALASESFAPNNPVQLPATKDAGDGMTANWTVQTNISEQGRTYAQSSTFIIPLEMEERAKADPNSNYIVFYATPTANEQTPTIAKIMNIFYKIIKVLFGQDLANKFGELMLEFGVAIED